MNLAIVVRVHAPEPILFCEVMRFFVTADTDSALDAALISVWHQALVERKKIVTVGEDTYPVRRASKHKLAQIDFEVEGIGIRGLEQNPHTTSRWAKLAREGSKVMQFLTAGRYINVVADGKLQHYGPREKAK